MLLRDMVTNMVSNEVCMAWFFLVRNAAELRVVRFISPGGILSEEKKSEQSIVSTNNETLEL